jgi:hypothetical protein
MLKNKVALVVDVSGSMGSIRQQAIQVANSIIDSLKAESDKHKQRTELTLYVFDSYVTKVYSNVNVKKAKEFNPNDFRLGHSTSLFDATGEALEDFKDSVDYDDDETSFVCLVITDGGENSSKNYPGDGRKISKLIKEVQDTDRFTITFQVPRHGSSTLTRIGIPAANIREWEAGTVEGIRDVGRTMSHSLSGYYGQRAMGQTAMRNFYVQTDLSNLNTRKLESKLDDVSREFRLLTVDKEYQIRDFVENKLGVPYKTGSAYYQLLKTEEVQNHKKVLILDRRNNHIYGGKQARNLIGLPEHAKAKVEPGLHGNYDIFVQSTSVNRKVGRGTKVLVEK